MIASTTAFPAPLSCVQEINSWDLTSKEKEIMKLWYFFFIFLTFTPTIDTTLLSRLPSTWASSSHFTCLSLHVLYVLIWLSTWTKHSCSLNDRSDGKRAGLPTLTQPQQCFRPQHSANQSSGSHWVVLVSGLNYQPFQLYWHSQELSKLISIHSSFSNAHFQYLSHSEAFIRKGVWCCLLAFKLNS